MKKKLIGSFIVGLFVLCFIGISNASLINPVSVSTLYGANINNSPDLIIDGFIPLEGTWWTDSVNVYWYDNDAKFRIDLGQEYHINRIVASFDNNDDYWIDLVDASNNITSYANIWLQDGNVPADPGGMDTFDSAGGDTFHYFAPGSIARYIDVMNAPIAQGWGDGFYAIGEVQVYGDPVPEPATMFLLGTGLVGVAGAARRKKKDQA